MTIFAEIIFVESLSKLKIIDFTFTNYESWEFKNKIKFSEPVYLSFSRLFVYLFAFSCYSSMLRLLR